MINTLSDFIGIHRHGFLMTTYIGMRLLDYRLWQTSFSVHDTDKPPSEVEPRFLLLECGGPFEFPQPTECFKNYAV